MKNYLNKFNDLIEVLTKFVAIILCLILVVASGFLTYNALVHIYRVDPLQATLDALFVVILLELVFAIRSFVKRGTINVGILVNVAVIASVKQLVFQLDKMDLHTAISFAVIFLSLGGLYIMEIIHFQKKNL